MTLSQAILWPLAALGLAAVTLGAMLAAPLKSPPPLASIHADAIAIPRDGLPALSRFQARDGTWLAYRLYPAANGASDRLAILAHGSSASSAEMNAAALALAGAGVVAVTIDARGHGASGSRGDIAYIGQLDDDLADLVAHLRDVLSRRAADADRPFVGRRLCAARRRRAARRGVRSLRAARALSRLHRADQPRRRRERAYGPRPTCRASSRWRC